MHRETLYVVWIVCSRASNGTVLSGQNEGDDILNVDQSMKSLNLNISADLNGDRKKKETSQM